MPLRPLACALACRSIKRAPALPTRPAAVGSSVRVNAPAFKLELLRLPGSVRLSSVPARDTTMKSSIQPDYTLWQNFLLLAGRLLVGWIFVESGFRKLMGMDAFIASLTNRHVPYASVLGWIGAAAEFFGGLAVLLGFWPRCAALVII